METKEKSTPFFFPRRIVTINTDLPKRRRKGALHGQGGKYKLKTGSGSSRHVKGGEISFCKKEGALHGPRPRMRPEIQRSLGRLTLIRIRGRRISEKRHRHREREARGSVQ